VPPQLVHYNTRMLNPQITEPDQLVSMPP